MPWVAITDDSQTREPALRSVRDAMEAAPPLLKRRFVRCRVALVDRLDNPDATSVWSVSNRSLEIELAAAALDAHDVALEALLCLGQAVWAGLSRRELAEWLDLLAAEIHSGVSGEIDEDVLEEKRKLLASRASARSSRRLLRYAGAAFAGALAEYVHALWHDVTVRTGPEHLTAARLRRRFELFARWFPPAPGQELFALA